MSRQAAKQASTTDLLDGSGGQLQQLGVELRVVDAESDLGSQGEPLVTHSIGEHASRVGESDGVGHVDHDGVSVPYGRKMTIRRCSDKETTKRKTHSKEGARYPTRRWETKNDRRR